MRHCTLQYFLFIPAEEKEAAETVANQIFRSTDAEYFTIGLSVSGDEPVSHYALATWANEDLKETFLEILSAGTLPGVQFFRLDLDGFTLTKTNVDSEKEGQAWDWEESISELGLKTIEANNV